MKLPPYLILKLEEDKIYYSPTSYTQVADTFQGDAASRGFKPETYFKVQVDNFVVQDKKAVIQIKSFESKDITTFNRQAGYDLDISRFVVRGDTGPLVNYILPRRTHSTYGTAPVKEEIPSLVVKAKKSKTHSLTFLCPIRDLSFFDGYVEARAYVRQVSTEVTFRVFNPFVHAQFVSVVPLLIKALDSKVAHIHSKLKVNADGTFEVLETTCKEIESISPSIAQKVNLRLVFDPYSKHRLGQDPQVTVSIKKLLKPMSNNAKQESELMEMFKNLLSTSVSRHHEYLLYLSDKHVYQKFNLRFIPKPEFSFLFLLEGEKRYHFVNETFSTSHATYVWHCEKSTAALKGNYQHLETVLTFIKEHNRNTYKSAHTDDFQIVRHVYEEENGFELWKEQLLAIID